MLIGNSSQMDAHVEEEVSGLICLEQKIVTAVTIARHCDTPISMANRILTEFYNKFKAEKSLHAVFSVCGQMVRNGTPCGAVVLAKQQDLEEVKSNFVEVESVDIFAVHLNDIDDVAQVMAHDIVEDDKFFRDDSSRAQIKTSQINSFRKEMETKHKAEVMQLDKIIKARTPKKEATVVKPVAKAKKQDLSQMFEKACKKEKTPKNSPVKVRESPFSSEKAVKQEDEEDSSPEPQPKRARKIIIDEEDDCKASSSKQVKQPKKEKTNKFKLADDDLFEAASPEKFEEPKPVYSTPEKPKRTKKVKSPNDEHKKDENVPLRRSPRKHVDALPAGKRKVVKKVTETFVDEDGFLLTKEVQREVSVEPEEEEEKKTTKPLSPKKTNPSANTIKPKKAAPAGQSKISSFFTKK